MTGRPARRRMGGIGILAALALLAALGSIAGPARAADVFTPVTVSTVGPDTMPVRGSDGRWHVVYELQLVNGKPAPATVQQVEVLNARRRGQVLARFSGAQVTERMFSTLPAPVIDAVIAPGEMRFLYIELSFRRRADVPRHVVHRLRLLGASNPGATEPTPLSYVAGRYDIRSGRPITLSSPLSGKNWVAINGCCSPTIVHRGSIQTVNGGFFDSQRFAIDWIRMNSAGRFFTGDGTDVRQHVAYGAPIFSAADGVVVSALDTLPDQVPGTLPPVASITLETVDGNHVVVALGHGLYAFYAHLQPGSVRVRPGDRVRRGQPLARLGNTGNTSAPHLHFHVMRSPSVLGSDGVPFVLRRFSLNGQIDAAAWAANDDELGGVWNQGRFKPRARRGAFPMDLDIVTFPEPERPARRAGRSAK